MCETKKLPIGLDSFAKIQNENFYYVDKSGFIKEILNNWGEVNLFTRPRRFGKTLNMDMLRRFFEIDTDKTLFDGLEIIKETQLCQEYMGQFPVVFISLKSVAGNDYESAYDMFGAMINETALNLQWLLGSEKLTKYDKLPLERMLENDFSKAIDLYQSLKVLSRLLYKHYDKKVIILIDEYDVPLDKAYQNGYYDEMVTLIRAVFERALKTNENLLFAVLTGCLRISKESIFTGLNNFGVHSISDNLYDEYFGFTDREVRKLLTDYGMFEKYDEVKSWYNGYRFGEEDVYCPWDVLNYVKEHLVNHSIEAKCYWANSSSNAIVRTMLEQATGTIKEQIETLVSGGTVDVQLVNELTYHDLDTKDEARRLVYLWSILYATGYLTDVEQVTEGRHRLRIPNREVQWIFEQQISGWFSETVQEDTGKLLAFRYAVKNGDARDVELRFNDYLQASISIRDTYVRRDKKENFYQGILLGLLSSAESWIVKSSVESGNGYSDILIKIPSEKIGCVIEVKYAENRTFESMCQEALLQIKDKAYTKKLQEDGMETIYSYGIACHMKEARVVCE